MVAPSLAAKRKRVSAGNGARVVARARKLVELTDGDVAVGALEHLVHAFGAEGGAEDPGDGFAGGDVGFLSIQTSESALLLLPLEDYERPSELVESQRHFDGSISSFSVTQKEQSRRRRKEEEEERAKTLLSPNPNLLYASSFPPFSDISITESQPDSYKGLRLRHLVWAVQPKPISHVSIAN